MNVNDLSAKELARIDAICLDYERKLRAGLVVSIDEIVNRLGGKHADILRAELDAVLAEVSTAAQLTLAPHEAASESATGVPPTEQPSRNPWKLLPEKSIPLPAPGALIGPYKLGEVLGRGGMGIVFQATDTRLDRLVAIKMLAVTGTHKKSLTERFQREAKAVAGLSHPNIVELFDVGVFGDLPYAVMEYLRGETLVDRLNGKSLGADEVRRLGAQIADALAAAHAGGVIHRDLKPHNIMLVRREGGDSSVRTDSAVSGKGHASDSPKSFDSAAYSSSTERASSQGSVEQSTIVKLVDFGLSRQPRESNVDDGHTRIGTIMGTPGYMAPEQARGEIVTHSADIFGLGCVLFEAFYGKRAFDGPTSAARFAAVLESTPEADPIRRREDPALAKLIDRCLAKSIEARPQSAVEIGRGLRSKRTLSDETDEVTETAHFTRRRFFESIAGGFTGAIGGQLLLEDHSAELGAIQRIAVISLLGNNPVRSPEDLASAVKLPVGERVLSGEEVLSGMLAQELQRLPNLMVRPYRPIIATSPDDFVVVGKELDVDAIVTGVYLTDQRGSKTFVEITLQMISAMTGNLIWTETIVAEKATSLVEQTELIGKLAAAIDRRLTPPTPGDGRTQKAEAFGCLSKGHTYLDPDNSIEGLEMAINCFKHAISVDGRYPDAYAGLSLTLIALATRGNDTEPIEILAKITQAREAYETAIEISPQSVDGRLAEAILNWQTLFRYGDSRSSLESLAASRPNDWRIRHQLGLLQMTEGDVPMARSSLQLASQLNPQSILVRTDIARFQWFTGTESRAVEAAKKLMQSFPNHALAIGLLVDVYEHLGQYESAASILPGVDPTVVKSRQAYFAARAKLIDQFPYGPFGALLNRSILTARESNSGVDETSFDHIAYSQAPALPMLVAMHPIFSATRNYERAKLMLPSSNQLGSRSQAEIIR